ncbi:MAG TPA: DUF4157 domain-containing protein, partial [Candidatus Binataceae bacterium]|nr:DUF4157 domain-containing protein [Candidatus Binataceae bacterium]
MRTRVASGAAAAPTAKSTVAPGSAHGGPDSSPDRREAFPQHKTKPLPEALFHALVTGVGTPLPDAARWAARIGADVSPARLVTGDRAARAAESINARAFTFGPRVFLGERGGGALHHELVHVAQQHGAALPAEGITITTPGAAVERAARHPVGRPARAPLSVARDEDEHEIQLAEPVDSGTYYETEKQFLWSEVFKALGKPDWDVGSPYAKWAYGAESFFWELQKKLEPLGWAELFAITRPQDLNAGIKRARRAYVASIPPNTAFQPWEEYRAVANEIAIRLRPLIPASLARVVPQFVAATFVAMKKERARTKESFDLMYPRPLPLRDSLVALTPSDRLIVDILLDPLGAKVSIDAQCFEKDGRDPEKDLVHVGIRAFQWQASSGNPLWIHVTDPLNARAEDVAATLYGDASYSAAIVPAGPYFGFYPDLLTFEQRGAFEASLGGKSVPATALNPFDTSAADDPGRWARAAMLDPSQDPALGKLQGPLANAVALAQAVKFPPTGKGRAEIVSRMRDTVLLLDGIRSEAESMNEPGSMVTPVREIVDARSKTLAASDGDAEAIKWDAQSQAQNRVVHRAANGVHHALEIYRSFTGTNTPNAAMMQDLAPFLRAALDRNVTAFLLGAVQAELVETATATLDHADLRSKKFSLDLLEGILNWIRWVLAAPKVGLNTLKLDWRDPYGTESMKEMERTFRARLLAARDYIVSDPEKVQAIIDEVQQDIFDLQSAAVVAETMSEIASEMNVLLEEQTFLGSINWDWWVTPIGDFSESKNDEYARNRDYLRKFYFDFYGISLSILSPSKASREDARAQLRALQPRVPELQQSLVNIAKMIERREKQEHWIALGLKIVALIAIAIATAGIGSYVSGALLVGAGWGTTTAGVVGAAIVSSGAEAASFTLLSTAILGADPQQSLLQSFLTNWALFGALKGLSLAYEGVVGAKAAATLVGKGGNVALGLAASIGYSLMDQNDKIKAAGGKGLTDEQATETVVTQLVIFIGTALVGRYAGKSFFEGAYLR